MPWRAVTDWLIGMVSADAYAPTRQVDPPETSFRAAETAAWGSVCSSALVISTLTPLAPAALSALFICSTAILPDFWPAGPYGARSPDSGMTWPMFKLNDALCAPLEPDPVPEPPPPPHAATPTRATASPTDAAVRRRNNLVSTGLLLIDSPVVLRSLDRQRERYTPRRRLAEASGPTRGSGCAPSPGRGCSWSADPWPCPSPPPGLRLVEHEFAVPLDHADPDGERITVFAR